MDRRPPTPTLPPRPVYSEDDALRQALALSLRTEKEDAERRRRMYGSSEALPTAPPRTRPLNTPSQNSASQPNLMRNIPSPNPTTTSVVPRPRPAPRVTSSDASGKLQPSSAKPTPVIPPRPGSQTQTALTNTGVRHGIQVLRDAPVTCPPAVKLTMPSLPPPAPTSRRDRSPIPTLVTPTDAPACSNFNAKTNCAPQNEEQPLIILSPRQKANDEFDYDLTSFDPLSNPLMANSLFEKKNVLAAPRNVSPFPQQQSTSSLTQHDGKNGLCPKPPMVHGVSFTKNKAYGLMDFTQMMDVQTKDQKPQSQAQREPWQPFNWQQQQQPQQQQPTPPQQPPPSPNPFLRATPPIPDSSPSQSPKRVGDATSIDDDDLIGFADEHIYDTVESLTLESFDPLYSLDNQIQTESNDSTGLFPDPLDKLKRRNTPNPFPNVNPQVTQKIMMTPGVRPCDTYGADPIYRYQARIPESPTAVENVADEEQQEQIEPPTRDYTELLDPFSVPDLCFALEQKRLKHAKLQEENLRKKKEEEEEQERLEEMKKKVVVKEGVTMRPQRQRAPLSRRSSIVAHMVKGKESAYEILHEFPETADEEIRAFCQMVARIKMTRGLNEGKCNYGLVMSERRRHPPYEKLTIKLVVRGDMIPDPGVQFTCDVNLSVEHVIGTVLLRLTDDLGSMSTDDYIFKVYGLSEFLQNDSVLADYRYVQHCLKVDQDITLVLHQHLNLPKVFKRQVNDDRSALYVPKPREVIDPALRVTRDKLNILMETFYKEVEKLRDQALQRGVSACQTCSVVQSVKAVCATLQQMESIDVIKATQRLAKINSDKGASDADAFVYCSRDGEMSTVPDVDNSRKVVDIDDLHIALEELTKAVKGLIELYCRTFHTDYRFESATGQMRDERVVGDLRENLLVHIATAHRIPDKMRHSYDDFRLVCALYYGGRQLVPEVSTQMRHSWSKGLGVTLVWDEWLQFDSVLLCNLPRETRLSFTLVGSKNVSSGSDQNRHRVNMPLGWVAMQIFDHNFELVQGSQLLGLWPGNVSSPTGTTISNTEAPNSILLQVNMPDFDADVLFPPIPDSSLSEKHEFSCLHPSHQASLLHIIECDSLTVLSREESELLWEKRHYLSEWPSALPRVLQTCTAWWWGSLRDTYGLVNIWAPLTPEHALNLFQPQFADTYVRSKAVEWLGELQSDSLEDYLPQLVQALKFESYHTSALARLLLEKAMCNVLLAHRLYWTLKEAADDFRYRKRYELMFGALLSVVGDGLRQEFQREEALCKMLSSIADKVKDAKDKEGVLQRELHNMWDFLGHDTLRLPLNPAMEVTGVDVKSCSYYTSFTFPLKLVLRNVDPTAGAHYIMFKAGDDLRQDMLVMQLVDLMDKLWLQNGLDLKMVTFNCMPTSIKKGMVELVTESDTLRKIQTKHGLAGSFKDRPIAEWLQMQNPTELEYEKAVENFTRSCAGYCVATYVLGICDRHNDNIMIKHSGHLFHIDFAKFLGDAQMFGNFKRDRVPFVLTSDMAYVINGGDKASGRFQVFVDLCCQSFNILRKHRNLLINIFSMMVLSGIPGVTRDAAKYVQKAMMPDSTDAEATASFTRMIHDSMKSTFTQVNFFLHNLAQMKFSGHDGVTLLSFVTKTYTLEQDGRISGVDIHGIQKRYNPEKYYVYITRVEREGQKVPAYVFRRYSEFQELHQKLVVMFPLVRLPSLHAKVVLGRTHVRSVAELRQAELATFLHELFALAPEIIDSDLIYTFFHPLLRDEQDMNKTDMKKLKEPKASMARTSSKPSPPKLQQRTVHGSVKLSMFYHGEAFTVMVQHVKDLGTTSTGDAPDPYVKLYLQPDPNKHTKRKTKIAKSTYNPTYNEMLIYQLPQEDIRKRHLHVSVWNYDSVKENEFLGAVLLRLADMDLTKDSSAWYPLATLHKMSTS